MKKSHRPESGRLIEVSGEDPFGKFSCIGKWVEYKNQPGKGRFMMRCKDDTYIFARETWAAVDDWKYIEADQ